ncbi:MAG: hypothetical protein IID15_06700 [Candidatus Marinimicrobia bacterium]|nr:hypothetical protein [Candidatus Neomarinimicrobiota bacterium]
MRVIVHSFFIIPFLIAVFAVLIFAMLKLVVGTPPNLEQALSTISRGSETERWQAAMDLTAMLQAQRSENIDPRFLDQLSFEFRRSATERQPYLRTYLALAMGLTREPRFERDLIDGLEESAVPSTLASIKSLGMVGTAVAESLLVNLLPGDDLRMILESIIALGRLGRPSSIPHLLPFLEHPEANLRWDSAISLAKLGDRSGRETIGRLLERSYYINFPLVDELEQDRAIFIAVEIARLWQDSFFKENLEYLSRNDPNLRIADAALKALKVLNGDVQ